ncbi:hypothetical protein C2E21_5999 [Chlorella sorokiniana]|uniref:Uncharacterized protein n=1 Tax=Chlorella sorokiniana TaxID=3076 RepID=A0A2P6TM66_CHLSO|nr:hypothetical protein C2E21_5999 [Chlorella sorokiniana]|eukprot:PRW45430.1 hypothetical protein C2E21_5999 [Chlorella sorokiniana]
MGAGGSKAAAAQRTASRAAAAAGRPPAAAAAAAGEAAPGISAAEREREAALRAQAAAAAAEPADAAAQREAAERQQLVRSMQAVMSGVKQYQFEVYQNPETDRKYAVKKKSKEEKEAELVGRLTSPILRQLLEEHAWSVRQGKPLDAAALARKYGAREDALAGVLQHNAMPIAYDTRLVMIMFNGNEANAVRVIELAWQWCVDQGLSKREIERLMRHFQHSDRYTAFREWETTSLLNWQLFDRYLAAAAEAPVAVGQPALPVNFAAMLRSSLTSLERVTEMLTVPPAELAAFLDSLAQRLSPAAAGRFVASMPATDPLNFRPGQVLTALEWLLENPPFSSMEGAALASFLPSVRSLLSYGAEDLQQWLAALQRSAGLTMEQAGQLVLRQPEVLRSSAVSIEAAAARLRQLVPADTLNALLSRQPQLLVAPEYKLEQLLRTLRLWTQTVGVPAEAVLARYDSLKGRIEELLRCDATTLQQRLAALQQEAGLSVDAAGSLAAAHPDLLLTPTTVLQGAAAWLRQHLPADVFAAVFTPDSRLLAASESKLEQLRNTLQLWTEVLGTPLDTVLQQYKQCFQSTRQLAQVDGAVLQERMASLQQLAGVAAEQARAAVMQNFNLLLTPTERLQSNAARLGQMLPAQLLGPLLASQPQLLASQEWDLDRMALAVQLWTQVVGVPLQTVAARLQDAVSGVQWFSRYQPSTLRRSMTGLRNAIEGAMTAEQLAAFVFQHPDLLAKQPSMVKEAGDWLRDNMAPETTRALLERDPGLLGASQWLLKETTAKLRLWTDIVGVPLPTVIQHYASCVGDIDILLPDLAAAYVLERAPTQLRTEDGTGSLNWWLNRRSAVQAMGLPEAAAARMMEHFVQIERGKALVASLRMSETQLRSRIRKITKREKMRSFVLELEECGLTELAAEARARLATL